MEMVEYAMPPWQQVTLALRIFRLSIYRVRMGRGNLAP
jgi:hypothetical protein